jgi:hypothetical protein
MTWRIGIDEQGRGRAMHMLAPRLSAFWTTGDDPEGMAAIEGPCWTDEGANEADSIHLHGFEWIDGKPDQAAFEQLMQEAVRAIDRHIAGSL